jgi:hypothetical protein
MHIKIAQLHSKRGELGPEREFYKAPVGCGLITKAPSHIRFAVWLYTAKYARLHGNDHPVWIRGALHHGTAYRGHGSTYRNISTHEDRHLETAVCVPETGSPRRRKHWLVVRTMLELEVFIFEMFLFHIFCVIRSEILKIMAQVAVLTNAGLITFTMDVLDKYGLDVKLWFFILFQWACYLFQVSFDAELRIYLLWCVLFVALQRAAANVVSGNPLEVDIQLKRAEFFSEKILLHLPDDTTQQFDDGDAADRGVDDKSARRYLVHTTSETGRFQSPLMSDLKYHNQILSSCLEKKSSSGGGVVSSAHSPMIVVGEGRVTSRATMEIVGSLDMEGADALEFYTPPSSYTDSAVLMSGGGEEDLL